MKNGKIASLVVLAALASFIVFPKTASAFEDHGLGLGLSKINFGICNARMHIALNITRFNNRQDARVLAYYQNIVNSLTAQADKFTAQGKDTTIFKADIETLKTKIATLKTDMDALITMAQDFQLVSCSTADVSKQAFTDLVNQQRKIQADRRDIDVFIRTKIIPDINALRIVHTPTPTPTVVPTSTPTPTSTV